MGGAVSLSRYEELAEPFTEALRQAECTTVRRAAMFCAQIGHESLGLRYFEEIWGPTPSQRGYEGRRDLGNTVAGDGYRFRGRGPIQVTGRFNYSQLSQWSFKRGITNSPTLFVEKPDLLSTPEYGFLGAVWYWTVHNLNKHADNGDVNTATRVINGGYNGLQDRINRYNVALSMGDQLIPGDSLMAAKDDIINFIKAYVGPIISDVKDIREQLTGSRDLIRDSNGRVDLAKSFPGWKQLGQRPDGSNNTVVDAIGVLIADNADLKRRVEQLEKK